MATWLLQAPPGRRGERRAESESQRPEDENHTEAGGDIDPLIDHPKHRRLLTLLSLLLLSARVPAAQSLWEQVEQEPRHGDKSLLS